MEEALTACIEDQRGNHLRVTRTAVHKKALEFYGGKVNFSASRTSSGETDSVLGKEVRGFLGI